MADVMEMIWAILAHQPWLCSGLMISPRHFSRLFSLKNLRQLDLIIMKSLPVCAVSLERYLSRASLPDVSVRSRSPPQIFIRVGFSLILSIKALVASIPPVKNNEELPPLCNLLIYRG